MKKSVILAVTLISALFSILFVSAETGSLNITSTPSYADVWIDGVWIGSGPCTPCTIFDLNVGLHSINISKSGYMSRTLPVYIFQGSNSLYADFTNNILTVTEPSNSRSISTADNIFYDNINYIYNNYGFDFSEIPNPNATFSLVFNGSEIPTYSTPTICLDPDCSQYTMSASIYRRIFLDNEFINQIISENSEIPISIRVENSGLPVGTSVSFEIFVQNSGNFFTGAYPPKMDLRTGDNPLVGIVDESGNIVIEWLISKNDLAKMDINEKGSRIYFKFFINGVEAGINPTFNLEFVTKSGNCVGIPLCQNTKEKTCKQLENSGSESISCAWNEENRLCEGEISISCLEAEDRDTCEFFTCTWKANNIFERFADWIKSIFSGR